MYSKEELQRMSKRIEEDMKEKELEIDDGKKYLSSANLEIKCTHCSHDYFHKSKALLNTRGMTYFNLDWLNETATTLICDKCGNILWFGKEVYSIEEKKA
ncbi:hypothetical protein [Evansella tamaricis]|uniref:DNA-binding protein n=1 Tax=Evansella tamaricis TaxID=2069301 RepID=A0ABS6JK38_9BACI|nr:hypothetical protein [Evansella tamaricis]MBU9714046.1 hypothetical protein [Evansella tamaricis]